MAERKADILKKIYLFSGLHDNDLEPLAQMAISRIFPVTLPFSGRAKRPWGFIYSSEAR